MEIPEQIAHIGLVFLFRLWTSNCWLGKANHPIVNLSGYKSPFGTKYSRMDQVKFEEDSLKNWCDWSPEANLITSNFLKVVFHKFYLVHSWILWPICCNRRLQFDDILKDFIWSLHEQFFLSERPLSNQFFIVESIVFRYMLPANSMTILIVAIKSSIFRRTAGKNVEKHSLKDVLKIYRKFTEHPSGKVISIKLLQHYWNRTSAWVLYCKFAVYF